MSLSILLRRIKRHIHFRLPNASTRRELITLHRVNPDRVRADYAVLAELSRGLSGGNILKVCVNAIYAGSVDADPAKWVVTQGMLEREITKVKKAKTEHSGETTGAKRRIGFQPGLSAEKLLLNGPGRVGPGRGAETGCEEV